MSTDRLFSRLEVISGSGTRPERDLELARPRRNVYVEASQVPEDGAGRYLLTVRSAHRTLTGDHVFSHESAAALHGLPWLRRWPDEVHLICERRTGGRTQRDVVRHCVGLEHVDPVVVDGMLVTSPARTAFDIALTRPFDQAVVVADAAFRLHPGAREEFAELLATYGRRRGFQRAAEVLRFADERSGSAGESFSRTEMYRLGFVIPELQVRIVTDGREEFADFGWIESQTLGEFDGEVKYRDERLRRGRSVEQVVIDEKNRENRLRAQSQYFARWDHSDLVQGRLEAILLRARVPRRTTSTVRPVPARYSSPPRGR